MTRLSTRQFVGLLIMLGVLAIVIVIRLVLYRAPGGALELGWHSGDIARFRLTAVAIAAVVGSSLAVSGTLLQALLRNPLASPFILGVSGGAALGVVVAGYLGFVIGWETLRTGSNTFPAMIGAIATLLVVYGLGQRGALLDPLSLVLIGVVVSSICGALIMFVQHLVPNGLRGDLVTWMMGAIRQGVPIATLVSGAVIALGGACIATWFGRAMDAATLGDDEARSVGLSLGPLRLWMFVLAGALAAVAVALAGPIGFVGLIAPHAARLLIGPQHTPLVPAAAIIGATLVIAADIGSQVISVSSSRMPAGVFTALLGGPAFIWLLRSGRGQA